MSVIEYDEVDDTGHLWDMYRMAFEDIDGLAVQRHLMHRDEFEAVLADKRVGKFVTADRSGLPESLAVMTNDLAAWPLISPAYFARRWSDLYLARKIWYVGFVAVRAGASAGLFGHLINTMAERIVAAKGICAMDFCAVNADRNLPLASDRTIRRRFPAEVCEQVDRQEFWVYAPAGWPE
jgi:hypothetical protein